MKNSFTNTLATGALALTTACLPKHKPDQDPTSPYIDITTKAIQKVYDQDGIKPDEQADTLVLIQTDQWGHAKGFITCTPARPGDTQTVNLGTGIGPDGYVVAARITTWKDSEVTVHEMPFYEVPEHLQEQAFERDAELVKQALIKQARKDAHNQAMDTEAEDLTDKNADTTKQSIVVESYKIADILIAIPSPWLIPYPKDQTSPLSNVEHYIHPNNGPVVIYGYNPYCFERNLTNQH